METDKKKYIYKIRKVSLEKEGDYNMPYIKITMVARFYGGKFDKFISMEEAIDLLEDMCFTKDNKDMVMSKDEFKKKSKQKMQDSILFDIK